ncbi:MAG: signal peptidase [Actinomycetota bacterium]|jgi:signal peptidase|nr:signal peptidase [Actinomycetota bacterium]MDQ1507462.1 signal peptidase [Actinomycetota bacterium]
MSTAVLDVRTARPAPALPLAPAAVRLVVKASLGVVVLSLVTLVVGPRMYPFESFYVRSGSMSPTIPVGGLVIATRAPAAHLGQGDVIVFQRPGRPGTMVVHRIYAVVQTPTGRAFMTKGDANPGPDDWVVAATGDGWRAEYSIARAGFAVGWLHAALSRRGWLGAFAIVVAVCALISIWQSEEP